MVKLISVPILGQVYLKVPKTWLRRCLIEILKHELLHMKFYVSFTTAFSLSFLNYDISETYFIFLHSYFLYSSAFNCLWFLHLQLLQLFNYAEHEFLLLNCEWCSNLRRSPLDSGWWSCSRHASWFCNFESSKAIFCYEQAQENGS